MLDHAEELEHHHTRMYSQVLPGVKREHAQLLQNPHDLLQANNQVILGKR